MVEKLHGPVVSRTKSTALLSLYGQVQAITDLGAISMTGDMRRWPV
jgi:hypothetical protein